MAGRGTGVPNWFVCPAARRARVWPDPYPPGHHRIRRTGRTEPRRVDGNFHAGRTLDTRHEFVCGCGHRGWTTLAGILDYPIDETLA